MFAALVVQRNAAHLYRAKSTFNHPINELSLRAFHGRPSSIQLALTARGSRLYATVPNTPSTSKSQSTPIPPLEAKKKAKVELRPSPKLPEAPLASTSNPPPPPTVQTSKAAEVDHVPQAPSTPSAAVPNPEPKGLRSSVDQAIADVLKASREGQLGFIDPNSPALSRLFRMGIELAKFYFRGVKAFFKHRTIVGEINKRCREEGRSRTWREERFVQLYKSDRLKLVPFILTALIIEELIPLIVIWAPFMLPSTCILMSQQERMDTSRLERQRYALAQLSTDLKIEPKSKVDYAQRVAELHPEVVRHLCGALSLRTYFPTPFLRQRLSSRLSYLKADDALLQPALPGLDIHELRQAVTERGGIAAGASGAYLHQWLVKWLKGVSNKEAEAGATDDPEKRRVGFLLNYARHQSANPPWASRV